jgi:hypothetical protein
MIKINLLPQDKRKAERTPLPRFFLIMATAAAAAVLILYNVWVNLIVIRGVEQDIAAEQTKLQMLQADVAKHDQLQTELSQLQAKVTEIKGLVTREVHWWRAVNALWDVIHDNPKVWIDDLRVLDDMSVNSEIRRIDPESKEAAPYGVSLRCHVAGHEVAEMTKFRNALKTHPVLQETLWYINFNPDWKVEEEKGFEEKNSISFAISMWGSVTPPKRRTPAAAPPGPAAAAAPADASTPGGTAR